MLMYYSPAITDTITKAVACGDDFFILEAHNSSVVYNYFSLITPVPLPQAVGCRAQRISPPPSPQLPSRPLRLVPRHESHEARAQQPPRPEETRHCGPHATPSARSRLLVKFICATILQGIQQPPRPRAVRGIRAQFQSFDEQTNPLLRLAAATKEPGQQSLSILIYYVLSRVPIIT